MSSEVKSQEPLDVKYMWEKLFTAVEILAGQDGTVTERLASAYESHLMGRDDPTYPAQSALPEEVSNEIKRVIQRLGACYDGRGFERGRGRSDLKGMDAEEARTLAERLVSLLDTVCRLRGQSEGLEGPFTFD